jgi:pimeloyl-ACP methyl ester carboxylesterase
MRCVFVPHRRVVSKRTQNSDFAPLSKTKLKMPVLSIGGEKSLGNELATQMKPVADNVTVIILPNTGHWIMEERPKETTDALLEFL